MFKEYEQGQLYLLPPDISSLIPKEHLSRLINDVVDRLDIRGITSQYSDLGQNAYHPRMLLKVLFYGYATGTRSSRKIAEKLEQDIAYMWLSGMQRPDFRTIALFRQGRLKEIKSLFVEIVELCVEAGITKIGRIFVDGTKIEANASGHKMIYLKSLERRARQIEEKIQGILDEAGNVDDQEDRKYGTKRGDELPRALRGRQNRLNKLREAASRIKEQKKILEERTNYAKTDKDANLMKMKRDYIYPGYNYQIAVNDRIIVGYGTSNHCCDNTLLKPQVEEYEAHYGQMPEEVIADSGYGVQGNYQYLEAKAIEGIIPYQYLEKDKSKANRDNPYSRDKFKYDEKEGKVRCPAGHLMAYEKDELDDKTRLSKKIFVGTRCGSCTGREICTAGRRRTYGYQPWWEQKKVKIRDQLSRGHTKTLYKRRKMEVEVVIGNIKHNMGFRKFLLRGIEKVNIEAGLISIAHNLVKMRRSRERLALNVT